MDINIQLRQPVMATHNTIMDIHNGNSNMEIQNSDVDICHSVMDIHSIMVMVRYLIWANDMACFGSCDRY